MSDPQPDPSGNTQAFRAFAQQRDQETASNKETPSRMPLFVGIGVAVLVVVAVIVYLVIR